MAKVVAQIKIFPTETTVDLQELRKAVEKALPAGTSVARFDEEPIAFGLIALIAHIVLPESSGELEKVERALKGIEEIDEAETTLVRRI